MPEDSQAADSTSFDAQVATGTSEKPAIRPIVLSIAGFDPSSGAGVAADLKVMAAFGIYGMACISALTVQSTQGVSAVEAVEAATVAATLQALSADVQFAGIKLGMLATAEICDVVAEFLERLPGVPVVLDPVLRSSSGRELLDMPGVGVLRERLLRRADWITPNLDELSVLTGMKVSGVCEVPTAAARLRELAAELGNRRLNVLATGGHLEPPDDHLLTASGECYRLRGERIETKATHGTGCALSSALVCRLARGDAPLAAATAAKRYVERAMRSAYPVGQGRGPMNHLFMLD